eukprot:14084293-Alexandrium_andersonii.AAC.2
MRFSAALTFSFLLSLLRIPPEGVGTQQRREKVKAAATAPFDRSHQASMRLSKAEQLDEFGAGLARCLHLRPIAPRGGGARISTSKGNAMRLRNGRSHALLWAKQFACWGKKRTSRANKLTASALSLSSRAPPSAVNRTSGPLRPRRRGKPSADRTAMANLPRPRADLLKGPSLPSCP